MNRILLALFLLIASTGCGLLRGTTPDSANTAIETIKNTNKKLYRFTLDNGMICLIKEDHSAPVVSIQIWVGTGSIHEHDLLGSGASHAIEHMIFKGTPTRKVGDITKEINDAGGYINAYTGMDRTVFLTDLPSEKWRVGLDVLADAVTHSLFPEEEWNKEKDVILREIAMCKDNPDRVLNELLWRTAFTTHPYKFPVIGYEQPFKALTRDQLIDFFHRNYVPDNMITVIAGDINRDETEKYVSGLFSGLERKSRAPVVIPQEPAQISARLARKTGSYNITRVQCVYHTVPLSHADVPALDILAEITGAGLSSRLTQNLKENLKLVESINAYSYTPKEPGVFEISATLAPENEEKVIAAIHAEIESWQKSEFTTGELEKAKRCLLSSQLNELQTMSGQAESYASGEFYAADPRFSTEYLNRINSVTPGMLKAVAAKYLTAQNETIAVLAPSAETEKSISEPSGKQTNEVRKITLPNGAVLLVKEEHRLPFVSFCAAFRGGLLSENESNNGITPLMADLITRGTKERNSREIAVAVESHGGMLSPFAGNDVFGLSAKCLSSDSQLFMDIFSDCLLNARFPEEEIEKQKKVQISAIDQMYERPFFLAQKELKQIMFPGHPYRRETLGSKETVQNITRDEIIAHFKAHVVSSNMVIAVFGDITPEQAIRMTTQALAAIPPKPAPVHEHKKPCPKYPARNKRREPREQAIFLAGFPGITVIDPRRDALDIIESSLSGLSADLAIEAREKRGLVYYIGARQQTGLEPGAFIIYAGTREDAIPEIEQLVTKEIERILTGGIREDEFERARKQIIADYEMSLQDNQYTAMACATGELIGLGYNHIFTTKERFENLTLKDINSAAASIMSTNIPAISLVLPKGSQ